MSRAAGSEGLSCVGQAVIRPLAGRSYVRLPAPPRASL